VTTVPRAHRSLLYFDSEARFREGQLTMIRIRAMTAADLPLGLRLSRQAGWNQTETDWRRALDLQPDGGFVAEWDGTPAGTTTFCLFGDVAWIAMVLVDEKLRRRGIGMALMRHALDFLDRLGVPTVRLDATPLGQPLYEQLGFVEQFRLARHEGTPPETPAGGTGVEAVGTEDWEVLAALDEAVTGTNRRSLLFHLFAEQPESVRLTRHAEGMSGFMAARAGSRAIQLGPCIVALDAGPRLFADAWSRYPGQRVFLDIPVANEAATRAAEAAGLTVQRHLTRMCRGTPRCEQFDALWASFGPEKG
jgi:GNAT superfamily N-acetyltransferase